MNLYSNNEYQDDYDLINIEDLTPKEIRNIQLYDKFIMEQNNKIKKEKDKKERSKKERRDKEIEEEKKEKEKEKEKEQEIKKLKKKYTFIAPTEKEMQDVYEKDYIPLHRKYLIKKKEKEKYQINKLRKEIIGYTKKEKKVETKTKKQKEREEREEKKKKEKKKKKKERKQKENEDIKIVNKIIYKDFYEDVDIDEGIGDGIDEGIGDGIDEGIDEGIDRNKYIQKSDGKILGWIGSGKESLKKVRKEGKKRWKREIPRPEYLLTNNVKYIGCDSFFIISYKERDGEAGKNKGEKLGSSETYFKLNDIKDWRKKLTNLWKTEFILDNKRWRSVEHYIQSIRFEQYPSYSHSFSLDSGSIISRDPYMASLVDKYGGMYKKKRIKPKKVKINRNFDPTVSLILATYAKVSQHYHILDILVGTGNACLFIRDGKKIKRAYWLEIVRKCVRMIILNKWAFMKIDRN
jgi:hypothetical protein